jgi:uncharacterized protein (DUF1778 family)
MTARAPKDARINIRLSESERAIIEKLATEAGLSISAWIVSTALKEAARTARKGP